MTTLYRKVGRRYVPVAEDFRRDSLPEGAHLIVVTPGSTLTITKIEPETAPLRAALVTPVNEIAGFVLEATKAQTHPPVTPEQVKAFKALTAAFGGGPYWLTYPSAMEVAEKIVNQLIKVKTP